MSSFSELIKNFSRDGKEFERLSKWILENHPLYKDKFKRVWLWEEWPDKWGQDLGIDLIAEDDEGKNWAVQSKNYNPKYLRKSLNSKIK